MLGEAMVCRKGSPVNIQVTYIHEFANIHSSMHVKYIIHAGNIREYIIPYVNPFIRIHNQFFFLSCRSSGD